MEKRTLLAVVLSLMILIAYQEWVARQYGTPPSPPPPQGEKAKEVEKSAAPTPKAQPVLQEAKPMAHPRQESVQEVRVETDHYVALFTTQGARLKSFSLKHYRTSVGEKSPPFEMISSTPGVPYPLGIQLPGGPPVTDEALVYSVRGGNLKLTGESKGTLVFEGKDTAGVKLTKEFTFTGSNYTIGVEISVQRGDESMSPSLLLSSDGNNKGAAQDAVFEGLLALVNNRIIREAGEEIKKGKELSGPVSWAGFGYTYFLFALLPESGAEQRLAVKETGPALVMDIKSQSAPTETGKSHYVLFVGPKDLDVLKALGKGLEDSIDFGWFGFVAKPFLYVVHFSNRYTGSYGIDIILLTILIKLILAPLTHKSFVSMKQMQKLQPQMERIKEKFKDD
ncbi:MAG: membrane protein insertase YidC, partial [Candidatus Binatota bacterium]